MEKVNEKLFTNDECNIIMKKNYNPLKVNYKIYEREGLFMKETKLMLRKIGKSNELSLKDRIIINLFPKTIIKVYGIAEKSVFNNIYTI